jgi:CheY-like chemotaxis protein
MRDPGVLKALVGVHVLVVNDDISTRELLHAVLTYCGAFVSHAPTAAEALDTITKRMPDVVLADIMLPGEDGYSLTRRLRAGDETRAIPIVALVAGREHGPDRTLSAGFDAHVRMPVDPWELCRMLASLTRKP